MYCSEFSIKVRAGFSEEFPEDFCDFFKTGYLVVETRNWC